MDQAPTFHPLDYVSMVRRRVWWLVVPIVLAVLVGVALALLLPREYLSTATLGISIPQMGDQVVSQAQLTPQERMRSINQVLLSPAVLERVAQDTGLTETMPLDAAVAHIAGNADVRLPPTASTAAAVEIFFVDFTSEEPAKAQQVANRLAEIFVDESSRKRTVRAEQTSVYLEEALKESGNQLAEIEARLAEAQESFMGSLPEQASANLALVTNLTRELDNLGIQLRSEQDRLNGVRDRLEFYRPSAPANGDPAVAAEPPPNQQVLEAEQRLAQALTIYTERHAEVRKLQRELELARARAAAQPATPAARRVATTGVDPEYQRLVDLEAQHQQRVDEVERTIATTKQQLADYRARVDVAPRVQQELAGLRREYELKQDEFGQITAKLREAEIAEDMQRMQGGEQFTIIAAAGYPSTPSSPNVPRLLTITLLLGVCLGGALAFGREYLDRSIHDARNLSDLDVPVLGEIPRISQV